MPTHGFSQALPEACSAMSMPKLERGASYSMPKRGKDKKIKEEDAGETEEEAEADEADDDVGTAWVDEVHGTEKANERARPPLLLSTPPTPALTLPGAAHGLFYSGTATPARQSSGYLLRSAMRPPAAPT